jgi:Transglycosylase SLT domain
MLAAAALVVILGAASVVGVADAGQHAGAPSVSATPAISASEIAAIPSPTGFPFDDPTFHPGSTADMFVPTPTPGPATPTPEPTAKPTPAPTPRDTVWNAKIYAKNRLGAGQYACLDRIFAYESKWNPTAGTPSGAYGIPQAKPGTKMAKFGSNWRYSPLIQVKWGIWYVNSRYGSACAAYAQIQDVGWY